MFTESKIFGPLTLRQFLTLAVAAILMYYIQETVEGARAYWIMLFLACAAIYICFVRLAPQKIDLDNWRMELAKHRNRMSVEQFIKKVKIGKAEVISQIAMRQEKGLPEDPELQKMLVKLESILSEADTKD